jgi:hypothetical protein
MQLFTVSTNISSLCIRICLEKEITLKKIISTSEECSGTSCEANENELSQNEDEIKILESDESEETGESSNSKEKNFQKVT